MKRNIKRKEARFDNTECKANQLELQGLEIGKSRKIIVKNDGKVNSSDAGFLLLQQKVNSSDAGFLLLQQVEQKHRIIEKLSDFFTDKRDQEKTTHSLGALLKQRIFGICQGYEDLNDHEQLRDDPLLQYICGRDDKISVAGKSTLNRLEFGHELDAKSPGMPGGLKSFSVNCFLRVSRSCRKP